MAINVPPTPKNTKAELLAAFEEMKEKYEETKKQQAPASLAAQMEEKELLAKTANFTPNNLNGEIDNLRRSIQGNLNELAEKITTESEKLLSVRAAIELEAKRLKEAKNIELGAMAMDALVADYEEKQKELEMKKQTAEEELSANITKQKTDWEREREEYEYNKKTERKKEEDDYNSQIAKKKSQWQDEINQREMELREKEEVMAKRAEEIRQLEELADNYSNKLAEAENTAQEKIVAELNKDFAVEKRISEQERLAEKNMLEAKIFALQETIKNQIMEIKSLKDALNIANQQAQTLAATVVESMAGMKQQMAMKTEIGKEIVK